MGYKKQSTEAEMPGIGRELISVRIDRLMDDPNSKVLAIASINIAESFAVHGIRIMNTEKGRFIAMPSSSFIDRDGQKQYSDICHPITALARCELFDKVNEAYEEKLQKVQAQAQRGVGPSIAQ